MQVDLLTEATILDDQIFNEIVEEHDPIDRERLIISLTDRAKKLGVKVEFGRILRAFLRIEKGIIAERKIQKVSRNFENYTDFDDARYQELFCGNWIADQNGIRTFTDFGECVACYHPILPTERLTNIETGTEKITLAFKKANRWREITVDKVQIATNTKITELANLGVAVTSENARYLVKYLSDIENFNIDIIPERVSTSRMGWISDEFMPYTDNVLFDGNGKFDDTFNAITQTGDYEKWLELVKYYRKKGRVELKFYLMASFASVLIKPLNALPFWCNLWGGTGIGKTVAEMIAVSVWADPTNNRYISDFKSTNVALEVKMDFLNNLPMVMDDTAQVKKRFGDDFSGLIYDLCSGKGKSRSNRQLGANTEKSWRNVIFSSGETPLSNESLQAGALNRILDLEAGTTPIFEDGQAVCEIIGANYGFAGKEFINIIKEIGFEKILELQKSILEDLKKQNKMEKQSVSLSILLTADRLATDYIFKDDCYIDLDDIKEVLMDTLTVSENERCYDYILGEVAVNTNKFKTNDYGDYQGECWGVIEKDYAVILANSFEKICKQGGFSSKGFLSWANKKGILKTDKGKNQKNKRINGSLAKCVFLRLKDDELERETTFDYEDFE